MALHFNDVLKFVAIPVLDEPVFTRREEIVRVSLESYLHDAISMSEEAFVTISKVQSPYLDVLVGGTGRDELRIRGYVHVQYGKFVAVEVEEVLERVGEEYLDSVVKERNGKQLPIRAVVYAQYVVRYFKDAALDEFQSGCFKLDRTISGLLWLTEISL